MDLKYDHRAEIHVLRPCLNNDATDLLAVGGDHSVDILLISDAQCRTIASFHVGSQITALAWSPNSLSPSSTDHWTIDIAAASADYGLHLLTKSSREDEHIFPFGGGLSGHHAKVNDMAFCGGWGEDSTRYVATVSDDKMLMVWDLHPTVDISSNIPTPTRLSEMADSPDPSSRPQPTAYVIPFPYALTSICSHPTTSKEFLVSDCRGSIYLTDWRSDPDDKERSNLRNSSLVELVEPFALGTSAMGLSTQLSGSVSWRGDTTDIIGAVYGSKFSIWDVSRLSGGKPFISGNSFPEGAQHFRWCSTYPEYFGISTHSPLKGATIHVHNVNFVQAQPTVFTLSPRPHFVRDFGFMAMKGIPRIAAAVGHTVIIFSIGVDS